MLQQPLNGFAIPVLAARDAKQFLCEKNVPSLYHIYMKEEVGCFLSLPLQSSFACHYHHNHYYISHLTNYIIIVIIFCIISVINIINHNHYDSKQLTHNILKCLYVVYN